MMMNFDDGGGGGGGGDSRIFTAGSRTYFGEDGSVQSSEPHHGKQPRQRLPGTRGSQTDHERNRKMPLACHLTPSSGRPTAVSVVYIGLLRGITAAP